MTHAAARAIGHLLVLHVIPRRRKERAVAGVVVVHVRKDDVVHRLRPDADPLQTVFNRVGNGASALLRHAGVEPRIHDECAGLPNDRPHEIIEWHGDVVRIAANEVLGGTARVVRILHCEDAIVFRRWHDRESLRCRLLWNGSYLSAVAGLVSASGGVSTVAAPAISSSERFLVSGPMAATISACSSKVPAIKDTTPTMPNDANATATRYGTRMLKPRPTVLHRPEPRKRTSVGKSSGT